MPASPAITSSPATAPPSLSPSSSAAAGALVRAAALCCAFPFDVMKSMVQAQAPQYTSLLHMPRMLRDLRFSVYNGFPAPLMHTIVNGSIMFGTQAAASERLSLVMGLDQGPNWFISGCISGALGGAVAAVPEQVKITMAVNRRHSSSLHALRELLAAKGARGIACGLLVTIMRNASFDATYFTVNNGAKVRCASADLPPLQRAAALSAVSCAAGMLAGTINYPLDVIKTNLQAALLNSPRDAPPSLLATARRLRLQAGGGYAVFYRGLLPRLAHFGVTWACVGLGFAVAERVVRNA